MQDNELDHLFRNKLDGLEIEPSAKVWKGIVTELDGKTKRRTLIPVFRIAATITVIVAAGLYFMFKDVKPVNNNNLTKVNTKDKTAVIVDDDGNRTSVITKQVQQTPAVAKTQINKTPQQISNAGINKAQTKPVVHSFEEQHLIAQTKAKQTPEDNIVNNGKEPLQQPQTLAAVSETKHEQAVVPDVPLRAKEEIIEPVEGFKTGNPVVAATGTDNNKPAKKRHGIRSFGDLINVVVAKVDKRQDKLVEFSDTDGDESTITGINLGIVKVKKDK
ncbi:hypothetical protein [Mucilaginibacter sp. KACC 22063]|uniref:hypothetical protein n=1 Tax=Mucilaginibacter sp. KACC 22063 TaxID=3025666 RepID=UPI002366E434|nr:hypothetical protein [Mucilaginibacter sp. KACC 22063]WDF56508.1 hypothetical protein PQ461_05520 [Mucilaginibacter sp. KACC 22063]